MGWDAYLSWPDTEGRRPATRSPRFRSDGRQYAAWLVEVSGSAASLAVRGPSLR
jgi:hypothetical protein